MAADGLDAAHEKVRDAAGTGVAADFSKPDDPAQLPDYEDEEHWAGRTVDGEWLADFLVDENEPKHRRGVNIVGARIVGGLDVSWATVDRPLRLASCQLGPHRISMVDAHLRSIRLPASACGGLMGDGARIVGRVHLGTGFSVTGCVQLIGATIDGDLDCADGRFRSRRLATVHSTQRQARHDHVIALDRAEIAGGVFLNGGFAAAGEVRLLGVTIGGDLNCSRGIFTNPDGDALALDGARVGGSVFLGTGFTATGQVRLLGATIGGSLECDNGTFTSGAKCRNALAVDRARITGSVFLRSGFAATGEVRFLGATIDGNLECSTGTFANCDAYALSLDRARITGGVLLDNEFAATGGVRLHGATIGGNLDCSGGSFASRKAGALTVEGAQITGSVFLRDEFRLNGNLSLVNASVGALTDDKPSWPPHLGLEGFTYGWLSSPDDGWKDRREWLRRQLRPSPLAYLQLAAVYRAGGDERSARKILMERHNARLRPPEHWKDQLPKGPWGWARRAGRWFLRLAIGHGYEPWRVLGFAVPLLLAMTLWYADARRHDVLVPARATGAVASHCDDRQVCVQPFVYAIDTLVPLVELRQRSEWVPDQSRRDGTWYRDGRWLAAATWLTSLLGWVFATLVAASFTQVVRRE